MPKDKVSVTVDADVLAVADADAKAIGVNRSELIEQALPYQLGARTTYTHGPEGVRCTISIPVSEMTSEAQHG